MARLLPLAGVLVVCLALLTATHAAPKAPTPAQELASLVAGLTTSGLTTFASVANSTGPYQTHTLPLPPLAP